MVYPASVRLLTLESLRGSDPSRIAGTLARLIASGHARTRPQLVRATGLARSTVGIHLDALLDAGVVVEAGTGEPAGRGRPASALKLARTAGLVLVAEVMPRRTQLAVAGLDQQVQCRDSLDLDISCGPERSLEIVAERLLALVAACGRTVDEVRALIVSLPGPVDIRRGVPVRPPIMPGWDGFPVAQSLTERFGCAVLVDNDVNLMALGEARVLPSDQLPLLFIRVGTGIGGGLVTAADELHHGADGAAGDIGHVRVSGGDDIVCSCGNTGCVEAIASARAITRELARVRNAPDLTQDDLAHLVRSGDPVATRLVRDAAAVLGEVVASLVHFYNPARVVLGGALAAESDDILAGVRSVVYQRALPLATRNLTLAHSVLGGDAGLIGGVVVGVEHILSPAGMAAMLRDGGRQTAVEPIGEPGRATAAEVWAGQV